DHGAGAPVQYFTPPAKPASPSPVMDEASPQVSKASLEVVAAVAPIAAVPVTAMPALVQVSALLPVKSAAAPRTALSAPPSAERFVPDMPGEFPDPPYPRWARQQGVQGRLLVLVDVAASGAPSSVAVRESSGHPSLDQHALVVSSCLSSSNFNNPLHVPPSRQHRGRPLPARRTDHVSAAHRRLDRHRGRR
ncbi:TonB family protein, partial [bacterium]|nr:TonB family protein [bacterium]